MDKSTIYTKKESEEKHYEKLASTFLALVLVATAAVTANAASIKNGALNFNGGQTKKYIQISVMQRRVMLEQKIMENTGMSRQS